MRKFNKIIVAIFGLLFLLGAKIGENTLRLGDKTGSDVEIQMGDGLVRWNDGTSKMQFSNDGAIFSDLGETVILDPVEFNHVNNAGAEINTVGWAAYADAAGGTPVDGTGGAPTTTLTRITSGQLRGVGSFRITKDAADRQGEGVSFDFTIDDADLGKEVEILFEHKEAANYVDDDIQVFIFNKDTPGLVTTELQNIKEGEVVFKTKFTADAADLNYRLIFHIASTNATTYTFDFDNVKVRPAHAVVGLVSSDSPQQLRLEFFTVVNPGNGAVSLESSDWISGNCVVNGTGDNSCTIISGIFSSAPVCWGICSSTVACNVSMKAVPTAVLVRFFTSDVGVPAATNDYTVIWCLGPK